MRQHSITNPLTAEEQHRGLVADPAGLTLDELAWWINAITEDIAVRREEITEGASLPLRLDVLRYEMKIRTEPRPVIDPPVHTAEFNRTYHLDGISCCEGEIEGVLAVTANTDPSPHFPEIARIFVGAPEQSPLTKRPIPDISGGFAMSVATAEKWISTLQAAIRDVRSAIKEPPPQGDRHGKEG
jgi:hypothetical protein